VVENDVVVVPAVCGAGQLGTDRPVEIDRHSQPPAS
jgi:hypothetical protein